MIASPPDLSPWLKHNQTLLDKFMADNAMLDTEPRISGHHPTIPLNPMSFPAFSYNPSAAWWKDKAGKTSLWVTFRHHVAGVHTALGIAEIGDHGSAVRAKTLSIQGDSVEDARFFWHDNQLWLSWVVSNWDGYTDPQSIVRFAKVNEDWELSPSVQPKYGRNDMTAMEKNWCLFAVNQHLLCIYRTWPEQVVVEFDVEGNVLNEYKCEGFKWLWGEPRGGSMLWTREGQLLRIFHSGLDNETWPKDAPGMAHPRRYYVGACVMEAKPPFKVIKVSERPILRGSIDDDLSAEQRKTCRHYKGRVIFPGGAVASRDGYLIACGINDSSMAMVQVTQEQLGLK